MALARNNQSSTPTRRSALLGGTLLIGASIAFASAPLPALAVQKKMSQKAANYQPTPKGAARCDGCALFQKPAACQTVEGVISPSGWCILYAAK